MVEHTNRAHALLSASGATRWLNCHPSARLEEKMPNKETSYAAEGTLAHEFADLGLQVASKQLTPAKYKKAVAKLEKDPLFSPEMHEEVQKYIDYAMAEYKAAKKATKDALLLIEAKVDLTAYIEDGFGTCDNIIIADGVMEVNDLKYGKGVRVDAEENSQLKLYALGALHAHELSYDIHTIKCTIVQPRLDHISSWLVSADDLREWGENVVKPGAVKAYAGDGVQKAGTWCKWCKAKARCATLASQNMKVTAHDFKDPHLMTDAQLLHVYKMFGQISDWIGAVSDYIKAEALRGKKWKGYKLVEGRSNRAWSDTVKVEELLLDEGYDPDQILTSKLNGIGKLEKLLGKPAFNSLLGNLVVKPAGNPTLVPDSDKREPMGLAGAVKDFS